MALTVAVSTYDVAGTQRVNRGTFALDTSYPTGGEAFTLAQLGLGGGTLEYLEVGPTTGYVFAVDYTNKKLKVLQGQSLGVLNVTTTAVGNVTTGEDDLMTYTLPAAALSVNGMGVRITAWGTGANNANAKTLKAYFGDDVILTESLTASQVDTWRLEAEVVRTGAATQEVIANLNQGGTTTIVDAEQSAPDQDLTAAVVIKLTGEATSTNDIVQEGMLIETFAAPGTGTGTIEVPSGVDLSSLTGIRWTARGW